MSKDTAPYELPEVWVWSTFEQLVAISQLDSTPWITQALFLKFELQ